MDAAETAGIVVIAVAALRLAEVALSRSFTKRNGGSNGTARVVRLLESIHKSAAASVLNTDKLIEMHDVKDQNGVFLWMIPREWCKTLDDVQTEQREQSRCLERIENRIGERP